MLHRFYLTSRQRPVILNPTYSTDIPASLWHLDHQQAHDVFRAASGVGTGNNFKEYNLNSEKDLKWWTFINHFEHNVANQTLVR